MASDPAVRSPLVSLDLLDKISEWIKLKAEIKIYENQFMDHEIIKKLRRAKRLKHDIILRRAHLELNLPFTNITELLKHLKTHLNL